MGLAALGRTLILSAGCDNEVLAIINRNLSSQAEEIIAGDDGQNGSMVSDIVKSISSGYLNIFGYDISYEIIAVIIAILTAALALIEWTYHMLSKIKDKIVGWLRKKTSGDESDRSKPKTKIINVPELPPHFLPRPDDLDKIKDLILAKADEPVVVTGASKVGLHGMGGIGKSVMAAAVARDEETQRAFPDGILWLTLGINPKLLRGSPTYR